MMSLIYAPAQPQPRNKIEHAQAASASSLERATRRQHTEQLCLQNRLFRRLATSNRGDGRERHADICHFIYFPCIATGEIINIESPASFADEARRERHFFDDEMPTLFLYMMAQRFHAFSMLPATLDCTALRPITIGFVKYFATRACCYTYLEVTGAIISFLDFCAKPK